MNFNAPNAPNQQIGDQLKKVYLYMLVTGIFAITKLFWSMNWVFTDIINLLIQWCAISQFDPCQMVMFILFSLFPCVYILVEIFTVFQHGISPFDLSPSDSLVFFLKVLAVGVYIVGVVLGFYMYREFKAYRRGQPGSNASQSMPLTNWGQSSGQQFTRNNNDDANNQNNDAEDYTAFQGKGVVL